MGMANPFEPPEDAVDDPQALMMLMREKREGPLSTPNPGYGLEPMRMEFGTENFSESQDIPKPVDANPFKDPMGEQKGLTYDPDNKRGFVPDNEAGMDMGMGMGGQGASPGMGMEAPPSRPSPDAEAMKDLYIQRAMQQRDQAEQRTEQTLKQNLQRQRQAEQYI